MRIAKLSALLLATACGSSSRDNSPKDAPNIPHPDAPKRDAPAMPPDAAPDAQAMFCDALDLLIVVDTSSTMAGYQIGLGNDAQALITKLDQIGLSYRIGITTAARNYTYYIPTPFGPEMIQIHGESGLLMQMAGCGMTSRWINYTDPDRATKLGCAVKQGTAGPAQQMPLASMRDAFEARIADATNAGFHRSDALLGVIMVTDNEDCSYEQPVTLPGGQGLCVDSLEPIDNYLAFMDTYAGGRTHWAASVIANTGSAMCTTGLGTANPAPRLASFPTDAGAQGSSSTICTTDLGSGLTQAAMKFATSCGH